MTYIAVIPLGSGRDCGPLTCRSGSYSKDLLRPVTDVRLYFPAWLSDGTGSVSAGRDRKAVSAGGRVWWSGEN